MDDISRYLEEEDPPYSPKIEEYSLYSGSVILKFDVDKHIYTYLGNPVPGVTSITDSVLDKSPAISGWALKMAHMYLEEHWPIDGVVPKSSPLFDSLMKGMKSASWKKKKIAATIGTQAHEWVENYIRAAMLFQDSPPLPDHPKVRSAVQNFLAWISNNHVVFISCERKVYSVQFNYAGTLDILALVNGVLTLIDIKTSNRFRKEYILQTAAYAAGINEEIEFNGEKEEKVLNRTVLMLPKDEEGQFDIVDFGPDTYERDREAFLNALMLYRWLKVC